MYWNVYYYLVFYSLALVVLLLDGVRAQGVNLGKLHWCDTLCLCHDDTMEKMHCFQDTEIYSLLEVDAKKVQRLSKIGFELDEKLMWCNETCLCHKAGKKEFKCTNKVRLGEFIDREAPSLSSYLEPETEIFDAREIIHKEDELVPQIEGEIGEAEEADRKDRHERRRNRKHRKNRKKAHRGRKQEEENQMEEEGEGTEETTRTSTAPSVVEVITAEPQDSRRVHSAGIFSGGSSDDHDTPSTRSTEGEGHTPVLEVPRERKTMAGEVANELDELRDNVDRIKKNVTFNKHILLVTVAVAAIAMIGVLILAIYLCCIRKSAKKLPNSPKNSSLRQETNNVTKVNLDEAW